MKLDRVFAEIPLDDLPVVLFAMAKRFERGFMAVDVDRLCADAKGLAAVFLAPAVLSTIVWEEARKLLGSERVCTMVS
jgi:hypothetical protein